MSSFQKISDLTAGSALGGTEQLEAVQSSASVYITPDQIITYAESALATTFAAYNSATVTATSVITGEFIFSENNELDYSSSITDGGTGTITFTELPTTTVAIHVIIRASDTATNPTLRFQRTSGGTQTIVINGTFADGGVNIIQGIYWLPTYQNTIYLDAAVCDSDKVFIIVGYKVSA